MKSKLLGTSPTLDDMKKLIAEFYCTSADRITLTLVNPSLWGIKVGDKEMTMTKVVSKKSRFHFQGV